VSSLASVPSKRTMHWPPDLLGSRTVADHQPPSEKANRLYARFATMVAMEGVETDMPFYPKGLEESLIRNDFLWAASNRDRILKEWQTRYDAKIEK